MRSDLVAAAGALLLLAGCQEQKTVVLEQSSSANVASVGAPGVYRPAPLPSAPPSPCAAPRGTGPFERLPHPVSSITVHTPERVRAERMDACVGVRFRLAPDGSPEDISVLAEYSAGYGMGQFGIDVISGTRWPARDDEAWRYLVINLHPRGEPG